jgi:sigma-B regulation protein RsbQ
LPGTPSNVIARHHVVDGGPPEGRVLLFAHGFGCDQNMWRQMILSFNDSYRVISFDHMGSGLSDAEGYEREKYSTLDAYVADLLQICDEMDLRDVVLVAHSVATMMAVLAAVSAPERFSRLILVAPSPSYIDDPATGYIGGFSREDIDGLLQSLDSNYFAWSAAFAPAIMGGQNSPELAGELEASFCRTDPDMARTFAQVSFLSDIRSRLKEVTVPALILQCSDDMLAPPAVGRYLHAHLTGSTLIELAATGHVPQASAPEETAHAILKYLEVDR